MKKPVFENIFRSNEVSFDDNGIAVCPCCNGTGLNDDFNLFNAFNEQMRSNVTACCVRCYGKGQTDWIEVTNGRIDEIMKYLFYNKRQFMALDLHYFLGYVYVGYFIPNGGNIQLWYDEDEDEWSETTGIQSPCHIESKNEIIYWINEFTKHSYIKNPESFPSLCYEVYGPILDYECAAKIKSKILNSTELNIYDLVRMRKELIILGFTTEDLNRIVSPDESAGTLKVDFVFTWENLLDKFKLPRRHRFSSIPEGVLTFD